jgi:broad specificity phosphatase PhoE
MALADVPADVWATWRADPAWAPPGGESLTDVGARVRAACVDLADEAATRDVVVVSHVSPIKAAVAWALGVGDAVAWRMFLDVAGVCRIATGPSGPSLRSYNESHPALSDAV